MTYPEARRWIMEQLPMFQRKGVSAYKEDLSNIKRLSERLGFPERNFKSIHVAGTNGKGSVSHMLAAIFQSAGFKTGLFTSPHLKDYRERIKINGKMIPKNEVVNFVEENQHFMEEQELSFFEMSVGLAFQYFSQEKVDVAIVETGLGGRLDATNIIRPELSIITNISLDHTFILGDSTAKIAVEKAGVIKRDTPVVIGDKQRATKGIFEQKAKECAAPIYFTEDFSFPVYTFELKGNYQQENGKTVLKAIELLQEKGWAIPTEAVKQGLLRVTELTGLRGRWQILQHSPKIICDTGHNESAMEKVIEQLLEEQHDKLHMVIGMVADKSIAQILALFPVKATYYFCKAAIPRGLDAELLKEQAAEFGLAGKAYLSVEEAFQAAKKQAAANDLIFVGGSTFTVAEVL